MIKSSTCWLTVVALLIGASAVLHVLSQDASTAAVPENPVALVTGPAHLPSMRSEVGQLLSPSDDNVGLRVHETDVASAPQLSESVVITAPSLAVKYASATRPELEFALRESRVHFEARTKSVIADRRARGQETEVTAGPDGAFPTGNDAWPGGVKPVAGSIRGSARRPGVAMMVQLLPGEDPESDELAAEIDWLQQRLHALGASGG